MDQIKIVEALELGQIQWRRHALERMLQRGIGRSEVKKALIFGEIIESYETDVPFESALFFHNVEKTLHVVASLDELNKMVYIITAYEPDILHFEDDLKTRKK
ncbi:MAG: Unknown protein [uncultured Sulfurovum sp.]|uniref:DUF4258 domain-containing protein n=1 Tax=uncultured Sulfurovum sp. TaxID=269237 RepID=A0A6S6RZE2_9BACT|nr:MAG: Unknown protein [uncultured Sulfurovum sp.]